MKYRAVIFDLFGTLVPNFSEKAYRRTVKDMAGILSVPDENFLELWADTFEESILGILPDPAARIRYICRKLDIQPAEEKVAEAARLRFDYEAETMIACPEALGMLSGLKKSGYRIGLISDCSYEAPAVWHNTPLASFFDVTVFSCLVGMRKPDPRIYRLALEQFGLSARECCYIGDGSSRELSGAAKVGLRAVQLRVPGEFGEDVYRLGLENWQGEFISTLSEVPDLLV
ncbi:MAG: HAD-IA family hydrolase [Dehalococcoidales bacterium]|nr:HAD-IA family hydrolase [Dehalococcoidales bacterium]